MSLLGMLNREQFLIPDDAFPILENAYVFRGRIRRKQGYEALAQFRRIFTAKAGVNTVRSTDTTIELFTEFPVNLVNEPNAMVEPGSTADPISIVIAAPGSVTLTDSAGTGTMTSDAIGQISDATINYATGVITFTSVGVWGPSVMAITAAYFPGLPCMGLREQELPATNVERIIGFDTTYAYVLTGSPSKWTELDSTTTWTGNDANFFWTTNYFVDTSTPPRKLFWATNFSGIAGDPMRVFAGTTGTWTNFAPAITSTQFLHQARILIPFRSRFYALNTFEGTSLAASTQHFQRIRFSQIGTPLPASDANAWREDIPGRGNFLDIPTTQSIIGAGYVRDNLVIYCERSTWQLRYTGRQIAPVQIERVNDELGAESTFSMVNFDTSLVGIGDKGIVECDSFKTERIDLKIPDIPIGEIAHTIQARYGRDDRMSPGTYYNILCGQCRLADG